MSNLRALSLALLASTAMASPAFAQNTQPQTTGQSPAPGTNATDVTTPPPPVQQAQAARGIPDQSEIIITATKREENLQNVPISVQVLGTRRLDQLNISNFEQYTKQLPSVTFLTAQPGFTTVYMRGVAATSSGEGNHSGSLPTVGTYLDEQPVTTIGGTLDVHIYDIARIESLAGPQGTLYGASSEAGTIRIITNKPELGVTTGRIDGEINSVNHGGVGAKLEGMLNIPIGAHVAFRGVGFLERDAGYIDNVFGTRTYHGGSDDDGGGAGAASVIHTAATTEISVDNSCCVKNDINNVDIYGGRAALKVDLDDNWTVLPQLMYQNTRTKGVFFEDPSLGDLKVQRFRPEFAHDHFTQAALTIQGKLGMFDVTYAGAYMDRKRHTDTDYTEYTDAYEAYAQASGFNGILDYWGYKDDAGNDIDPRQHITGRDHFKKLSQELRIATPADKPIRALIGAFYQRQSNDIFQDYITDNEAAGLSVPGWPGTVWLTKQKRVDRDYALFGEANWDITPQLTFTAGGRFYKFDNTIIGFNGYGPINPTNFFTGNMGTPGYNHCLTTTGAELVNNPGGTLITTGGVAGTPCTNVGTVVDGNLLPKRNKDNGFIHRLNVQWKPRSGLMLYATWSRGFRPGGINRQPTADAYAADFLTNYELGWKTTFLGSRLRWNGALYHQRWSGFQFSFLGANSLTVIQNGRAATINGVESDLNYVSGGLSLTLTGAYTDAKTKGAICHASTDTTSDCSGLDSKGKPDYVETPTGSRLPVTPKFKGSATARYSWGLADGKAHVQGVVSYQGSASADIRLDVGGVNPNDILGKIRSSTVVDLFAGYDWQNYSFELFASNVFDKRNELSRFVNCSICTQTKIVVGRPRTIGMRAGLKF
jgi:iron complex outermembrane receptor protein